MRKGLFTILLCYFFGINSIFANSAIAWKETHIPMSQAGRAGLETLLVWPNDGKRHPVALITHGAVRGESHPSDMTAISFLPMAKEFVRRGFSVAVVLRRGYGSSGGVADENVALTSARDLQVASNYVAKLPQFDSARMLAVGVSNGGLATIALTADNPPPGLMGAISFAGGQCVKTNNTACSDDALIAMFSELGKTSRVPMLWVYAENDHVYPPELARKFYEAFTKSGGDAQFAVVQAFGSDGHFLFSQEGISVWTTYLDQFLKSQDFILVDHLAPVATITMHPPTSLSETGKENFYEFLNAAPHKAFVVSRDGTYGWFMGKRSVAEAKQLALQACQQRTDEVCRVYAVDDKKF